MRRRALAIAQATGQEPRLRKVQRAIESPVQRRGRQDNELFALLCAATLREDSNCVDVGAHDGHLLQEIVRAAPRGHHLAFEPIPEIARRLRTAFPEVDVHAEALSDRETTAEFVHDLDRPARSGFPRPWRMPQRGRLLEVPVTSLDQAVGNGYLASLIKVDVEGAELPVLYGARRTLMRNKPVVVFEHAATSNTEELLEYFSELGYVVFDMDGGGPYDAHAMNQAIAAHKRWNWFARSR
jgi:FkbM family methyltransferase